MNEGRPIRLFVDAHVFDHEFQGTRTFLREIYTQLARRPNLELYLAARDIKNLERNFPGAGIRILPYKTDSSIRRLAWEIPALLSRYRFDFAHFQYVCPPVKRCRYIVTLHDVIFSEYPAEFSLFYRISKKMLFKRSAAMADLITTVSDYSQRSIRKFLDVDPKVPIQIVPNGVAEKFFAPYDREQAGKRIAGKYGFEKYILYVSRFEPRKNHNILLKAWLDLRLYDRGYYLVFLGHRSIPVPDLDETLQGLPDPVRDLVFFADRAGDEELMDFYRAAAVFVYPSKAEGFGIPPLEAAAMKVPVICSNSSAMEQFNFFGDNHIDPMDLPLLTRRLSAILESPPSPAQLELIARRVHKEYSWEHAANSLLNALILAQTAQKSH